MALSIQEAADIVEISQLRSAYSWHYDSSDLESLIDLFTDDAVCNFGPYGIWDGIDAIRAGYAANLTPPDDQFATIHISTNPLIKLNGDTASGRWFILDHILASSGGPLKMIGAYNDEYRRVNGDWKISRTRLDFFWSADAGRIKGEMKQMLKGSPK